MKMRCRLSAEVSAKPSATVTPDLTITIEPTKD
jgi:hypothetical protein